MDKPVVSKLILRSIIGAWITSWVSLFLFTEYLARSRPKHPDWDAGFVYYLKAASAVVYVNATDHLTFVILSTVAVISLLSFLSLGFVFRVEEDPGSTQ